MNPTNLTLIFSMIPPGRLLTVDALALVSVTGRGSWGGFRFRLLLQVHEPFVVRIYSKKVQQAIAVEVACEHPAFSQVVIDHRNRLRGLKGTVAVPEEYRQRSG